MRLLPLFAAALLLLSGCCGRADCDIVINPLIHVRFENFTLSELNSGMGRVYGEVGKAAIDSFNLYDNQISIHRQVPAQMMADADTVIIVFAIANHSDTLKDMAYTTEHVRSSCNDCFLKKDNTFRTIYNISQYTFNNVVVNTNANLIIKK